jgi:hypothetical protein
MNNDNIVSNNINGVTTTDGSGSYYYPDLGYYSVEPFTFNYPYNVDKTRMAFNIAKMLIKEHDIVCEGVDGFINLVESILRTI